MRIAGKENFKIAYLNSILTTTISTENSLFCDIVCSVLFVGYCNEVPHKAAIFSILGSVQFLFYFPV